MSVTVLTHHDALKALDKDQIPAHSDPRNFFEVFGTDGCIMKCEIEKNLEPKFQYDKTRKSEPSKMKRREASLALRTYLRGSHGLLHSWFKASEITSSATQGCGSCSVFIRILEKSFLGNERGFSDDYEYLVSRTFELRRRRPRRPGEEVVLDEVVQLFQPPRSNVNLVGFKTSNFLCGRDVSLDRVRKWMDGCSSNHQQCKSNRDSQNDTVRPAKLLDISPMQRGNRAGIRIIETSSNYSYRYACLSHRWDDTIEKHQSTTENISNSLDFLDFDMMPTNFRDAVAIARELEIQYVWIDSLCIIQRGDDGEDLRRELGKMGSIYQNAYLTIAAVSSPSSSGGCFIKDTWPDICFQASDERGDLHLIGARVLDRKGTLVSFEDAKEHFPLLSRAWVFQERLLSPRILLCNYGEFAFECLESSTCECESSLAPHPRSDLGANLQWLGNLEFDHTRRLKGSSTSLEPGGLNTWSVIVETYMQLDLRYLSDTLPAIAGCAQVMSRGTRQNYLAGLWMETLPTNLLWYVQAKKGRTVPKPRTKESTAPSWSWASLSMGQVIRHIDPDLVSKGGRHQTEVWLTSDALLDNTIKEVHCVPESAMNPFGRLKSASIKFNATLYKWYLHLSCTMARPNVKTNTNKRRGRYHFYIETRYSLKCTTEPDVLVVDGADIDIRLDSDMHDEGVTMQTFSDCIGNPIHPCRLVDVHLLHALHKENELRSFDVFLLLHRLPPDNGRAHCYRRIGLMTVSLEEGNRKSWSEVMHTKLEPRPEFFWMF